VKFRFRRQHCSVAADDEPWRDEHQGRSGSCSLIYKTSGRTLPCVKTYLGPCLVTASNPTCPVCKFSAKQPIYINETYHSISLTAFLSPYFPPIIWSVTSDSHIESSVFEHLPLPQPLGSVDPNLRCCSRSTARAWIFRNSLPKIITQVSKGVCQHLVLLQTPLFKCKSFKCYPVRRSL
jgi:hypothetical protein